jgi:hypothetical protein
MTCAVVRIAIIVTTLLASVPPSSAQAPPNVDHYLCYKVRLAAGAPKFTPVSRTLLDQFPPIRTYDLRGVGTLCNPAGKNGVGMVHPTVHQVGYRIRPPKGAPTAITPSTHMTVDQFATRTLLMTRPDVLLVPSNKALGSGGAPPYTGGTTVDHYKCYRARGQSAFTPPVSPTVTDQFFTGGQTFRVRRPSRVCTPVDKNGEDPTAPDHAGHLVCYRVQLPMGVSFPITTVSTNNQIRPEVIEVMKPVELCVPALKDPTPSTTSTSVTSTSVTTTSVTTTTAPPCGDPGNPAGPPFCWGTCPPATPICASGPTGCECVAGTTACGDAGLPQCDGACPPDQACAISLTFGCTCEFQGLPCGIDYPTCSGICPNAGDDCVPISTPDGDGCICVPPGSTCWQTYPECGGTCPPGQTCGPGGIPGLCSCQ